MKRFLVMLMVALFSAVLIAPDADARRMGGGRSFGKQSDFTNRDAARPPAQSGQQAAPPPANGAAAAAGASRGRSWMGPIAGIAAGLGLAALASHLGLGEEFGTIILMALAFFAVLIAVRMFMARRRGGALGGAPGSAYAGAGAGGAGLRVPSKADQPWAARTATGGTMGGGNAATGAGGAGGWAPAAGATAAAAASPDVPADFDAERFIHGAKVYFVRLQAAFDNNRADDLREFTSPEMFAELSLDLMKRGEEKQTTDVVTLDARLLGVERSGEAELASVRFEGMLREASDEAAAPFVEVWNFTRPSDRSAGWVLAGIQQVN
jgi:predicted lipid-binding transport protein (Tim44 family)